MADFQNSCANLEEDILKSETPPNIEFLTSNEFWPRKQPETKWNKYLVSKLNIKPLM